CSEDLSAQLSALPSDEEIRSTGSLLRRALDASQAVPSRLPPLIDRVKRRSNHGQSAIFFLLVGSSLIQSFSMTVFHRDIGQLRKPCSARDFGKQGNDRGIDLTR
ncbi:hypothetical protein HID58_090736, partial [Brassica napus]